MERGSFIQQIVICCINNIYPLYTGRPLPVVCDGIRVDLNKMFHGEYQYNFGWIPTIAFGIMLAMLVGTAVGTGAGVLTGVLCGVGVLFGAIILFG